MTNAQFAAFVQATGHVTTAELPPRAEDYPEVDSAAAHAASLVFQPPSEVSSDLRDWRQWWVLQAGANWRLPLGPGSEAAPDHPVVHVSFTDAQAYAAWAGKQLPTEAEWEYAARGGIEGAEYAWGNDLVPDGRMMANYWQGRFPRENLMTDGYAGTSPVGAFPPNGYGVSDMIGNVWEWTTGRFEARHRVHQCCGQTPAQATSSAGPQGRMRVLKGGSYLCAANYCRRYRPAARIPQSMDTSACHIGFRCVVRCG